MATKQQVRAAAYKARISGTVPTRTVVREVVNKPDPNVRPATTKVVQNENLSKLRANMIEYRHHASSITPEMAGRLILAYNDFGPIPAKWRNWHLVLSSPDIMQRFTFGTLVSGCKSQAKLVEESWFGSRTTWWEWPVLVNGVLQRRSCKAFIIEPSDEDDMTQT